MLIYTTLLCVSCIPVSFVFSYVKRRIVTSTNSFVPYLLRTYVIYIRRSLVLAIDNIYSWRYRQILMYAAFKRTNRMTLNWIKG